MKSSFPLRAVVTFLAVLLVAAGVTVVALLSGDSSALRATASSDQRPTASERIAAEKVVDVTTGRQSETDEPAGRSCLAVGYGAPWNWSRLSQQDLDRTMEQAGALGATMVRIGLEWDLVEPVPGVHDWTAADRLVDSARRHGLDVIALLIGTPAWARDPHGEADSAMTPPADPEQFARFAGAAADRYDEGVLAWEIWNEPNIRDFWRTGAEPKAYAEMLRGSYTAIKAVQPDATVLSGGLAPSDTRDGYLAPNDFLRALYSLGVKDYFDGYAVHPYSYPDSPADPAKPWSPWQQMFDTRRILTTNGDGGKDIWITEFGAPTGLDDKAVSEAEQARILSDGIREASRIPWIRGFVVYTLRDVGVDPADKEDNFGVVDHDWKPKAAADAVRGAAVRFGC